MCLTTTSLAEHNPGEATVCHYSKRPFADGPPAGGARPGCRCEAEEQAGPRDERAVRGCFFQYPPLPSCSPASEEPVTLLPFIPRFVKTVERLTWAAAAVPLRPRPCLSAPPPPARTRSRDGQRGPSAAPSPSDLDSAETAGRTASVPPWSDGGAPCCGRRDCRGGGIKRAKCRRAADAHELPKAGFRRSPETRGSIGVGPVSPSSAVATAVAMPTFVGAAEILRSLSRLYASPTPSRSGRRGRPGCGPADNEYGDNADGDEYDYDASSPPPPPLSSAGIVFTPADTLHRRPPPYAGQESYPSAWSVTTATTPWSSSLSSGTLVLDDADPQQQQKQQQQQPSPRQEEPTRCYYSFPRPETHEPFECVAVRLNELLPRGCREQQQQQRTAAASRRLSRHRNHHPHHQQHHHHHHHRNSTHDPTVTDGEDNTATKARAAAPRGCAC